MSEVTEKGKFVGGRVALVIAACLLTLSAGGTYAQTGASAVRGTVADWQGALMPGATVTLRSEGKDFTLSQLTDGEGRFDFKAVPPDTYTVRVEAEGFKRVLVTGVKAGADAPAEVNVALEAGLGGLIKRDTPVRERVADLKPPIAEARPSTIRSVCGSRSYLVKDSAGAYLMFTFHTPDMPHPITVDNPLLSMESQADVDPASTFASERPPGGAERELLVKLLQRWRDAAIPKRKQRRFERYDRLKDEAAARRVFRSLSEEDSELFDMWYAIRDLEKGRE